MGSVKHYILNNCVCCYLCYSTQGHNFVTLILSTLPVVGMVGFEPTNPFGTCLNVNGIIKNCCCELMTQRYGYFMQITKFFGFFNDSLTLPLTSSLPLSLPLSSLLTLTLFASKPASQAIYWRQQTKYMHPKVKFPPIYIGNYQFPQIHKIWNWKINK